MYYLKIDGKKVDPSSVSLNDIVDEMVRIGFPLFTRSVREAIKLRDQLMELNWTKGLEL